MKKKGFTLIELVIAMALVFLMVGAIDSILISHLKNYKNSVLQNKGFNYLNEAILFLEKEVNHEANYVKTEENIIKINYLDGNTVNYIKCINGKLYILYGSVYSAPIDSSYKSIIIDDVKDFVAIRSGKIIYIKLTWKNDNTIQRCLAIENAN
jgi:prepilin-type N-terminal cleavage/methylation domain-containing protein